MKSKIFIFTTLILVVFLFVITSCDNFLNAKNKTTININLDLSKILKTSRNETTTIPTEYILKVFAYNAATYKSEDEIQNLPLLTQTENKVDINGNVKASLDIAIGLNVIFVAKLYQGKSEKPLYAGKSEVIKIKATDNKVHLVLTRENADLDIDILIHDHTFATDWTSDATHHWHEATCEHTTEVSEKAEHNFENWKVTKEPTEEAEGTREQTCTVCGYKATEAIAKLDHTHTFATDWAKDETNHWHAATCEHTTEVSGKAEHSFDNWTTTKEATEEAEGSKERSCTICGYTATEAIDKLAHTHKFATDWTKDATNHWHASTCGHTTEVSDKAEHSFGEYVSNNDATTEADGTKTRECSVCGYKDTVTDDGSKIHVHIFAEEWSSDGVYHWKWSTCEHEVVSGKAEHSFGNWTVTKAATEEAEGTRESTCTVCEYKATEAIAKLAHTHKFATDWTKDETNHWYASTCGHTTEVSGKAAHSFDDWTVTKAATEEAEGTKERSCTICGYTATEVIEKLAHTHKFATDWTKDETNHWYASTCGHTTEVSGKAAHSFGDWTTTKEATEEAEGTKERSCTICEYKVTEAIEKLAHTHKFATDWTKDETNHWYASTCGHDVTDSKAEHSFVNEVCTICEYSRIPEGFVFVKGTTINGNETWTPSSEVFVSGRKLTIPDLIVSDHEVTRGEYKAVMGSDPSTAAAYDKEGINLTGEDVLNNPVNKVSWYDALVYCNKLSMQENLTPCYTINSSTNPENWGTVPTSSNSTWNAVICNWNATGYRLPTEAEWEYAARGGDPTAADWNYMFSGADTAAGVSYSSTKNAGLDSVGWYSYNSIKGTTEDTYPLSGEQGFGTHQVGKKAPNRLGLYDMSGNVFEWFYDWYGTVITGEESYPTGSSDGSYRVLRGGSWKGDAFPATVACRGGYSHNYRDNDLGFRVVRPFPSTTE